MRRRRQWVAGVALCMTAAACAGPTANLNPLFIGHGEDALGREDAAQSQSLGPVFDDARLGPVRETAIHPIWRRLQTPEVDRTQVLFPLYQQRETDELFEWRMLALWWYRNHHPKDKPAEWDLRLIPLFWMGGGPPGENYLALFPLGGTIRPLVGFEQVLFVLFPLYYQARKNIVEPETFHNITPLIGWTSGGPREESWRILPLYGQWIHEGKHRKYSVLWPFFHYQRNRLDTKTPSTGVAVWPLFRWEQGANFVYSSFLWPFFRFNRETVELRDSATSKPSGFTADYYHTDFLWPLYRHQKTRDFTRLRLFPFFSRYRSEELDRDVFMIPLVWRNEHRRIQYTKNTFHVVPLFYRARTAWTDGRPAAKDLTLWPLFTSSNSGSGATNFEVPALIPVFIERYSGDFHANWSPWFSLFRNQTWPDGSRRVSLLFRLIDYRRDPLRTSWSIPLLYSGDRTRQRTTHDLLWGLIRVGTGEGGLELRLLFVPLVSPDTDPPRPPERDLR